jgi:SOS-response transcriptional repressor LexA
MTTERWMEGWRPDRAEGDADDTLAEAVGRLLGGDAMSALWADRRFVEWLAVEAREQDRPGRRRTDRELARQGRAILTRLCARQLGVSRAIASPRLRPPSVSGAPGDVLALASRERAALVIELGVAAGAGRELWDEPAERWLDLPAAAPTGQYLAVKVAGDSMAPLMHTGDMVLVRLGAEVERNTVIVARHPDDGYVCKRVGAVRDGTIELTSLEPGRPAIAIPHDPRLVVGTVLMVWCEHGGSTSGLAKV